MLSTFIIPTRVQADGGKLVEPIFKFVAWLGDQVLDFLQTKVGGLIPMGAEYKITYSPGNIFANKIAVFDINFINPNAYSQTVEQKVFQDNIGTKNFDGKLNYQDLVKKYGFPGIHAREYIKSRTSWGSYWNFTNKYNQYYEIWEWEYNGYKYSAELTADYRDYYGEDDITEFSLERSIIYTWRRK